MATATDLLDAAAACRDVACKAALALLRADGDADLALEILARIRQMPEAEPAAANELDACELAAAGIRDALELRG